MERLKRIWQTVRGRALEGRDWLRKYSAEISITLVGLIGWGALTLGLARLLGPVVWDFAIAVLCFSLFGWRLLRQVALDGLYTLTRPVDSEK